MKTKIVTIAALAILSSAAHSQTYSSTFFLPAPGDKTGTLNDGSTVTVTNTSGGFNFTANGPTWTPIYGSNFQFFRVPTSGTMQMSFSGGTAPADTRLIVIDADAAGESIDFTVPAGNPVLAPLEFWDSTDIVPAGGGGPTHYAVWDAPNTTLNPSSINGNRNATVFDISGFGTFDMTTSFNDGYVIGVFSPVVVPEPSSALLAGLGALGLLARRKR